MKTFRNVGSPRNKLTAFVAAAFLAFAVALSANVAEAGAKINYYVTNTYAGFGNVVIHGYFYNGGDDDGTVTQIKFTGTAGGVLINCAFDLDSYVAAGESINQDFTITDDRIWSDRSVNLQSVTTWF